MIVTINNPFGRIQDSKYKSGLTLTERDGLQFMIDYERMSKKQINYASTVKFNACGDSLIINDSNGGVMVYNFRENRYTTLV